MSTKNSVTSIVLFLSVFLMLVSCGQHHSEWIGKIEEINGVTVFKNPKEPIHGDDILKTVEQDEEGYLFCQAV